MSVGGSSKIIIDSCKSLAWSCSEIKIHNLLNATIYNDSQYELIVESFCADSHKNIRQKNFRFKENLQRQRLM
jgi:hypothetical protein